ncbi:arylamine N-acetyltransferase [Streptomyces sp. NPDC005955]|uniref:arylamine N-acetyltransferase family protein n=1 Tax=Streptomyces sp. NPDC005955 TaxID=3364738 RepID=UPI0036974886
MTSDHLAPALDLDAYLDHLGWSGGRTPTPATLRGLNRAHQLAIPFENLEAALGAAPSLDLAEVTAKLLGSRRGGYCYEHNTLFTAVLRRLGFTVTGLMARVQVGAQPGVLRPRTHMTLLVEVPGEPHPYLADVGFGSPGSLLEAIPFVADSVTETEGGRRHRLVLGERTGPLRSWLLQSWQSGAWEVQYAFTEEPFEAPDYAVANWHVATHPRSPFSSSVYVLRTFTDHHLQLVGNELTHLDLAGTRSVRALTGDPERLKVLSAEFGIDLPEGTRLP